MDLVVIVSGVSNERNVLMVQNADIKLPVKVKKMSISDMTSDTFEARLQGAEDVNFGNEHTSTRTNGELNSKLAILI